MLVRLIIDNFYSFGEQKEFNMFPAKKYTRLNEHKYKFKCFDLLKMSSIYGANGAGKSNLIKILANLQQLITEKDENDKDLHFSKSVYKFQDHPEIQPQTIAIEFVQASKVFFYAVRILKNIIIEEELYFSSLNGGEDKLLFHRKTDYETKEIKVTCKALDTESGKVLIDYLEKSLAKPTKSIFKWFTTLEQTVLNEILTAFKWFDSSLVIISPNAKPLGLPSKLNKDETFKEYVSDTMKTFHVGISKLETTKLNINELEGEGKEETLNKLHSEFDTDSKHNGMTLHAKTGKDQLDITREDGELYIHHLQLEHTGKNNMVAIFDLDEESDGTNRLLDFTPIFHKIINHEFVFIIDEIERSIHPLLIKELVKKFSLDEKTKGQLIFTTHESNLLDQNIFRQDEIWFAEKNKDGITDLYTLSEFKEHGSIDIRKGYLNGRYGSIPFLGNLKDLNWHEYDYKK